MKQLPLTLSLNPDSTFETFFVSEKNAQVLNVLQQFLYDDEHFLYLWSQAGDGVSHLLNAVQHVASTQMSCQHLPLKLLLAYPPQIVTDGLAQLDLVCIDDIDVIVNHKGWQQALFHLYNQLRDSGKKLMVAGHQSPRQLAVDLQDLKSRLQWGTVLYLEPLDDEHKTQALKQKAAQLGICLTDEVANYLLTRIERSNAAIYQTLMRLDQESLAEKRKLTIPFVKQVIEQA